MIGFLEEVMHDPELLTQERKAAANIIRYGSPASGTGVCPHCRARDGPRAGVQGGRRPPCRRALELPVRVSPPLPRHQALTPGGKNTARCPIHVHACQRLRRPVWWHRDTGLSTPD